MQTLDGAIAQHQNQQQIPNQQGQQERSDQISALTQHNNTNTPNPSEAQHLDGPLQHNLPIRIPNGVKLAIQQIARQFRPFNAPPAPQPISDEQIEAKEAENAADAEEAEERQARELEQEIERQDHGQPQHLVINVHDRERMRAANRFFTPHTTPTAHPPYPQLFQEIEEGQDGMHYDPNASIRDSEPQRKMGRIRQGPQVKSPSLRRRKIYAISVKRQRRLKMKKHKFKKLLRRTRTLRRKLDK